MWHDLGLWCIGIITGVYLEWLNNKGEEKKKKREERKREWGREEEE
jgi:hypothetical protein